MTPNEIYIKIKENALSHIAYLGEEKIHVVVQYGRCSQAVGAADVIAVLKQSIIDEGLKNVVVGITGCMGFCSYEPIVIIRRSGRRPVTYCRITPDKARVILPEYIYRDTIIKSWTLDGEGIVL